MEKMVLAAIMIDQIKADSETDHGFDFNYLARNSNFILKDMDLPLINRARITTTDVLKDYIESSNLYGHSSFIDSLGMNCFVSKDVAEYILIRHIPMYAFLKQNTKHINSTKGKLGAAKKASVNYITDYDLSDINNWQMKDGSQRYQKARYLKEFEVCCELSEGIVEFEEFKEQILQIKGA